MIRQHYTSRAIGAQLDVRKAASTALLFGTLVIILFFVPYREESINGHWSTIYKSILYSPTNGKIESTRLLLFLAAWAGICGLMVRLLPPVIRRRRGTLDDFK